MSEKTTTLDINNFYEKAHFNALLKIVIIQFFDQAQLCACVPKKKPIPPKTSIISRKSKKVFIIGNLFPNYLNLTVFILHAALFLDFGKGHLPVAF